MGDFKPRLWWPRHAASHEWVFLFLDLSDARTSGIIPCRWSRFRGNGRRMHSPREGFTPRGSPGDCGIFPATYNPSLNFCILLPSYDPLIDYYTYAGGAAWPGLTPYAPDRHVRKGRSDARNTQCGCPDPQPAQAGAGSRLSGCA
jgi:hypothetical protein